MTKSKPTHTPEPKAPGTQTDDTQPKAEVLSPEEIARREKEKAEILASFNATRPVRNRGGEAQPTAQPVTPAFPAPTSADRERLESELAAASAEVEAMEAAYKEAVKREAEVKAQADRDRADSLLAIRQKRDQIQKAADEAAQAVRAVRLAEIAAEVPDTIANNQTAAQAKGEAARNALRDQARVWLHEVEFCLRRARELDTQYRKALTVFAAQTVSTSPSEFPATTRNALSRKVYRVAESVLEQLDLFLAAARGNYHDTPLDAVLRGIVTTGQCAGSLAQIKFDVEKCLNRDGVDYIKRQIQILTEEMTRLYAEGRAAAGTTQSIPDPRTPDQTTRHDAKRAAQYSHLKSSRPTEADMGGSI